MKSSATATTKEEEMIKNRKISKGYTKNQKEVF